MVEETMLLITKVETRTVDRAEWPVMHYPRMPVPCDYPSEIPASEMRITQEIVRGREFVSADGKHCIIGLAREVQEELGLMYDAWDNLQRHVDDATNRMHAAYRCAKTHRTKLEALMRAPWWRRLRWVFTGVKAW
jgi:hypothetical protein